MAGKPPDTPQASASATVVNDASSIVDDKSLEAAAVRIVDAAFPNLKCLRCGSDKFYLKLQIKGFEFMQTHLAQTNDKDDGSADDIAELVCQRCGMIERHLLRFLRKTPKPVPLD